MRIGIFGGTFDPPHLGHLILAAEAHAQLQLDRVLWVLTPHPPHKPHQPLTPVEIRAEMVQACLVDAPEFALSTVDIDRPPPHYAVDTVRLLRAAHPGAESVYLMGHDSLLSLPSWHEPAAFVRECDEIGVIRRSDQEIDLTALEARLPGLTRKVRFVPTMILGVSSSDIRQRVREGLPIRYYLPPGVYDIIQKRKLYQTG